MKQLFLIIILIQTNIANSQTEGRKLLAHYPLESHYGDITGQEDTLENANVNFTIDGLYIDGGNPIGDKANQIKVRIEELDLDDFYIELEVNIDSIPEVEGAQLSRNIFVGGLGWRWIQVNLNQNIRAFRLLNNGAFSTKKFDYEFNTWYRIGIRYNRDSQAAQLYVDGQMISSDTLDLNTANDRVLALNCNCGPWNMKGLWKNLMVYGADNRSKPLALTCEENELPSEESAADGSIIFTIEGGVAPYKVNWNGGDTTFQEIGTYIIPNLGLGAYTIEVSDSIQNTTCQTTLQLPGQLPLIAHYPLEGDVQDALMLNNDLQITNVDIRDSALYIDGAEATSDTANFIIVPRISKLNHDEFEIRLSFNLDSLPTEGVPQNRTIFLAGTSFRWATLTYFNDTKDLRLGYNNISSSTKRIPFEFNQWYEMAITYNRKVRKLALWINEEKVDEVEVDLVTSNDQSIGLNCCSRPPMKGLWKNLRVYSTEKVIIPNLSLSNQTVEWNGTAESSDGALRVNIVGGNGPYLAKLFDQNEVIDSQQIFGREVVFKDLKVGIYDVVITDAFDSIQSTSFELLPPQTALPIMSYWPMDLSLNDTAGIHRGLALTNVEHIFQQGLSLPGNNNSAEQIDFISTSLSSMNQDDFYISLNITIDSIENLVGDLRSIFILGTATRWMYPYYSISDKRVYLAYNGEGHPEIGGFAFEYGKEYEIAISYNKLSQIGKLYIDRKEVVSATFNLDTGGDVSFDLNCNCGPAPMKGFWRDLRVYSQSAQTTSVQGAEVGTHIQLFPNPGYNEMSIVLQRPFTKNQQIIFYDAYGRIVKKSSLFAMEKTVRLDVRDLGPGIYWILIGGRIKKFIKLE